MSRTKVFNTTRLFYCQYIFLNLFFCTVFNFNVFFFSKESFAAVSSKFHHQGISFLCNAYNACSHCGCREYYNIYIYIDVANILLDIEMRMILIIIICPSASVFLHQIKWRVQLVLSISDRIFTKILSSFLTKYSSCSYSLDFKPESRMFFISLCSGDVNIRELGSMRVCQDFSSK